MYVIDHPKRRRLCTDPRSQRQVFPLQQMGKIFFASLRQISPNQSITYVFKIFLWLV